MQEDGSYIKDQNNAAPVNIPKEFHHGTGDIVMEAAVI